MLLVRSGEFSDENRCAKESHNESVSSWGLRCIGALGADLLIVIHISAELMVFLHSVIHWFQDRLHTWVHSLVYSLYVI